MIDTTPTAAPTAAPQAAPQAVAIAPVLPPRAPVPRAVQGLVTLIDIRGGMATLRRRYGSAFRIDLPIFGECVVLADPAEIKDLFHLPADQVSIIDANLGRVLGPNSMFNLVGERHRRERHLLTPPLHGKALRSYEQTMAEAAREELARLPLDTETPSMPAMMNLTLTIILKAVFGADGEHLEQLRRIMPPWVELGSRLNMWPVPTWDLGRFSPWGRYWNYRQAYDGIIDALIATALEDPALEERTDILALLLQSRYDDGTVMSHAEIADELLTLLTAGHETTATTLAWLIERLRRHPDVLTRLVAEVDAGRDDLLMACIYETQRVRPVINLTLRKVGEHPVRVGRWVLPPGQNVLVGIGLLHADEAIHPDAERFDPDRFLETKPNPAEWMPFGGGIRRCIGAAFATAEMRIVMQELLLAYEVLPTTEPDERFHFRGIAFTPAKGGRIRMRARRGAGAHPS